MKPLTTPLYLTLLFAFCLLCVVLLMMGMVIDWICRKLTLPEPFCIIKGIKDLEATDADAYIQ